MGLLAAGRWTQGRFVRRPINPCPFEIFSRSRMMRLRPRILPSLLARRSAAGCRGNASGRFPRSRVQSSPLRRRFSVHSEGRGRPMGETRVDLLHLLEDLRDAYPGSVEETILTEIVANSLDSHASRVSLQTDPAQSLLTVVDDGAGMRRRELARYHDIAASAKSRGEGIGFAGVGIKLGLLVCEEVLTETRRASSHVASRWNRASRHKAPWKWVPAPGLIAERGTAVRLKLRNPLSPLLDAGFLEGTLRRHFQPLLDPTFDEFLSAHYPKGVSIDVNGRRLQEQRSLAALQAPV